MKKTVNHSPIAAAASTAVVQQVQTPIKFDVPVFEDGNAASWLTWSGRVLYQARVCGFEVELAAAGGEELSVGADVFDGSNADPVRLQNAHEARMTLINNYRGMALKIVQRNEAPNGAWRNLKSHYRAKGTKKEILRLSHEVNGIAMQPGEDPF